MGVSAHYATCTSAYIDFYLSDTTQLEREFDPDGTLFQNDKTLTYENMDKFYYSVHLILTGGLKNITEDDLMSNAVAGQYFSLEKDMDFNWWEFYSSAYNTAERVQEIYPALVNLDIENIPYNPELGLPEKNYEINILIATELREFYKYAYENNFAVIVDFS